MLQASRGRIIPVPPVLCCNPDTLSTMMTRLLLASLVLSALTLSHGFSPAAFRPQQLVRTSQLAVASFSEYTDEATMTKAREYAFSERTTVDDAREYLHQILQIQSGCASGAVTGHDLCENQDEVAEIVAHLRQKIETGAAVAMR